MKKFELTPDMLTMGGAFYPRGYAVVMFANAEDARRVAGELEKDPSADVMLLDPGTILRDIGKADGDSEVPMPSVGTEGATVAKYVQLAREGHHALMVKVPSDEYADRLMTEVKKVPFSYGQRYRLLVIEDLE